MIEKFDKYRSVIHGVVGVSTVLDPRYKIKVLEFYFQKLFGEDYKEEVEQVCALCYKLVKEYNCRSPNLVEGIGDSSSQSSSMDIESLSEFDVFILQSKRKMKGESSSGYATIYDDMESGDSCVTREEMGAYSFFPVAIVIPSIGVPRCRRRLLPVADFIFDFTVEVELDKEKSERRRPEGI
ncbi:hypothetical protein Vadar_026822 [Vaccinium darrowii]|uniref:Uncharacterized protein n=1 Tax=Vaccinium darrowii TaxID=229202 RepID=A0ACB7Z6I9_9ERIC|nr:hypothetical protein Vadar_026822 [Vaccinium darrowii]